MRNILMSPLVICFLLASSLAAAEPPEPAAAAKPGIFGEFTLAGGERVIGLYHPEQGTIEVYGPTKTRVVTAFDIVDTRRLAPEPEVEPASLNAGEARVITLAGLVTDAQTDARRAENQYYDVMKARQSKALELSKREEGNKVAQEAMVNEQDPARKAVFAALTTEHLKAIAAANAAIAELDAALAANDARQKAAQAHRQDLRARMDWLLGRLKPMVREAEEKKAKK